MATDFALESFLSIDFNNTEDNVNTISNVINFKDFSFATENKSEDCNKLIRQTTMAIKSVANSSYKLSNFVDLLDIDQIKASLKAYKDNDTRVTEFKKELIDDLTEFQKRIKTHHTEKIVELKKQYRSYQRQLAALEGERNRLIMERLSKIVWPYDKETKEYDNKIAKLETITKQYGRKLEEAEKMRPIANEKDILLYQMHLKEKYQ